jgi:hypothetical protein
MVSCGLPSVLLTDSGVYFWAYCGSLPLDPKAVRSLSWSRKPYERGKLYAAAAFG